ncbi:MAG: LPP20 family lipoprotein [Gallionella sp.]|nr:LPP20 family lipoprotein [Gallionella sp.]
MSRLILFCLAAALLLPGCAGSGAKSGGSNTGAGLPAWILNPDKPGYQGVVGSAPKQDWGGREAQYRVALMKARQELAQMVRVQVESTTRYQIEDRAGKVSRDADFEAKLQSSVALSLEQARVIEEWVDPQSGELYLWLVTPK